MKGSLLQLILDQEGGAAMEYALIAGIVSLALFVILLLTRTGLQNLYQGIADALTEAVNSL